MPLSSAQFASVTEAVNIRQLQTAECNRLNYICSRVPEMYDPDKHGCHRWCYKNFTNVSRLRYVCVCVLD